MRKWSGCRVLSGNRCGGTQVSRTGWWPRPSCFSSRCSDVPADFGTWKRRSVGFGNRVSAAIATTTHEGRSSAILSGASRAPPKFVRSRSYNRTPGELWRRGDDPSGRRATPSEPRRTLSAFIREPGDNVGSAPHRGQRRASWPRCPRISHLSMHTQW